MMMINESSFKTLTRNISQLLKIYIEKAKISYFARKFLISRFQ